MEIGTMKAGRNLLFAVGVALFGLCDSALAAWTEPVPLIEINTDYHDRAPFLSFDGLTLYFARQDGPGWHYARLYQATRTDNLAPFTSIKEISTLNYSSGHVDYAWVSADNLRMYYYRTEPGSIRRIKFTKRATIDEEWKPGYNITSLYNLGDVSNPSLTQDELTIVFTGCNIPGGLGGYDLWMATRQKKDYAFTNITNLAEINSAELDAHPSISPDGLTLHFDSERNGTGQLFKATRESLDDRFDNAEHVSLFDSPGDYLCYPSPSHDGTAFYFVRWPENDMADIYVSYISETNTRYVDAVNGNDSNNGRSPDTAFATIKRGIDSAAKGFTILVYPGIYTEKIDFKGKGITLQGLVDATGVPVLENPGDFVVCFQDKEGPDSVMKNFVIRNSFMGIFIAGSSPTISNVTVVHNKYGINAYADSQPDISNCILWNNTKGNLYGCRVQYSCLKEADAGENNINADPLLADPDNGDYHLLSEHGRYWPEQDIWIIDEVTSPCIDGGDPAVNAFAEPIPNGGRINIGAYGGTHYASMSKM
jgi:hypothetical protein